MRSNLDVIADFMAEVIEYENREIHVSILFYDGSETELWLKKGQCLADMLPTQKYLCVEVLAFDSWLEFSPRTSLHNLANTGNLKAYYDIARSYDAAN